MKKDEILSAIGIFFGIGIVALVSKSIESNLSISLDILSILIKLSKSS